MRTSTWKRVGIALAIVVAVLGLLSFWFPGVNVVFAGAIALTVGVFLGTVRLTAIRDVMRPPKEDPSASVPSPAARWRCSDCGHLYGASREDADQADPPPPCPTCGGPGVQLPISG